MQLGFSKLGELFSITKHDGRAVGIDIGSSAIKVVELERSGGEATLVTYGEIALGPYAGVEVGRATNLNPSKLAEALGDIVREAKVSGKQAGVGISAASSFLATMSLSAVDEKQLTSMVPIEARKYVPVPISEVSLDWSVIPDRKGEERDDVRVLLAAIHNSALETYRAVLQQANIAETFAEMEVFSAIRSSVVDEGPVVLIDVGAATTKLYVVERGLVESTHSITLGAQDLTLSLAKALELPEGKAEELKRQVGVAGGDAAADPRVAQALTLTLERIVRESARVIAAYEKRGTPVEGVLLAGGGALLPGLVAYATEHLGKTAVHADPFAKVAHPEFLNETLKEAGPSFAVAIGLALRHLNEM